MDLPLSDEERDGLYWDTQSPVEAGRGTKYKCTQRTIDDYHRPSKRDNFSGFIPLSHSTQSLTTFLVSDPQASPEVEQALDRLCEARWNQNWGPDIIIKAAHDIDTAFFKSSLLGKITLRWGDIETILQRPHVEEDTKAYGMTYYEGRGRCTIYLNADMIFNAPFPCEQMWQTAFHEFLVSVNKSSSRSCFASSSGT